MNKTEKRMKIFTLIMQVIIQAVLLFPWMNMGTWKCNVPGYLIKLAASGDGMSYIKKSLKPLGVLDGADEQMMVQILMLFICELVMVLVIQVIGIVNLILALSNHHKLLLDIMSLIAGCMISFLGADGAVFSDPLSQVYPFLLVVLLVINLIGAKLIDSWQEEKKIQEEVKAREKNYKEEKKKEIMERSYGELMENVVSTRKGLLAEGFEGKHIALIGTSSVEWMESYLGIITGCTTAVPLDAALPCEDLIDLLNRSDSVALFLSPKLKPYLDAFLENCPKLQKVWMLQEEVEDAPAKVYGIGELRNAGKSASADSVCPDAEDIATIIFTSGTTGKSKGVMLTQNNLASNVEAVKITAEPGTAVLSVLPIHHAFCLVMDWLKGFSLGATLCINDSLLHMVRNMSIFKPEIMLMVPMMIETIYKRLAAADPSIPKTVLAEKVFGGKLRIIFTGGAHLDPYYIDRFAEYGVEVLEGYGMSECSPVISNNTLENNKKGSIGKPLENAEIRFENGEILVKGSSVMKGYYQMPDETAETLKDGWLHTGDKGYMDEDGYLFINGRVKNLIILSNGENVSPEEIENKLALNPLIGEVIVTGEDNGLTARIYPEQAVVEAKALDAEAIQAQLQAFLDEYNRNQPTYRRITGLVVRKNPFIRNTTKKIRRQDVLIDEPLE